MKVSIVGRLKALPRRAFVKTGGAYSSPSIGISFIEGYSRRARCVKFNDGRKKSNALSNHWWQSGGWKFLNRVDPE